MEKLVLASASPRRAHLLAEHDYHFEVVPPEIAEISPEHLTAGEIVRWNARAKALSVARQRPTEIVLGVDTLVAFEGRIFGKPRDFSEALQMARTLNGQTHEVFSGVALLQLDRHLERTFVEVTRVHFHRLEDIQLRAYLERIGPLDKAGAYAAQDDQGELIARVEGSFSNVIGLPMEALGAALRTFALHS